MNSHQHLYAQNTYGNIILGDEFLSESRKLHQELERIGLQLGFMRTKVSGLEFDLYKDGVVIELAWGDGNEVWKDLCKVQVARHAGLQVHKLVILCRDYPSRSMTGYTYIKNAVEKMEPILRDVEIEIVKMEKPQELREVMKRFQSGNV